MLLVHMNGRVYDYNVGRFLSVDPFLHGEAGSQGINPYSYVFNNPLAGTDPSGYNPDARASAFGLQMAVITGTISAEDARTIEAVISASPLDIGEHAGAADTGESIRIAIETGSIMAAAVAMQKAVEAKANKKRRGSRQRSENGADNDQSASSSKSTSGIGSLSNTNVQQNAKQGALFEKKVVSETEKTHVDVREQITIKTKNGVNTRIDCVAKCSKTGDIELIEAKSSATARLTKNQKKGYPEIENTGGTIVGKGKAPYVGGTVIKPTKVKVVRPEKSKDASVGCLGRRHECGG